jgi:nucleotide-binding universal stress UspA family protein
MGALSQTLFTMILAMAVVTTMAMPPMLRWSLARVPLRPDEAARLEREAFEAEGFVPKIERLLVAVDESASGRLASQIIGLLAGSRRIPTTMLRMESKSRSRQTEKVEILARATAEAAEPENPEPEATPAPVDITARPHEASVAEAVAREARKGYDLLVVGVEPVAEDGAFAEKVARVAGEFKGPLAIAAARGSHRRAGVRRALDILVPVTGTSYSRRGAEVALALARADHGSVTALYVAMPNRPSWRRPLATPWAIGADEEAILREIVQLGDRVGISVRTLVRRNAMPEESILRRLHNGSHNLIVMGVSPRPGGTLSFGHAAAAVFARSERSILFVST